METNVPDGFVDLVQAAVKVLKQGGVIAYPTEYCFGLGCDPRNEEAVNRLLTVKRRKAEQGVILIAADIDQVRLYSPFDSIPNPEPITSSWPGPNTWLLPAHNDVPGFIKGKHKTIAMRIPKHDYCLALLSSYGHPIVSTSANRSGESEHLTAQTVEQDLGQECDLVVHAEVGAESQPSTIRDAISGAVLR